MFLHVGCVAVGVSVCSMCLHMWCVMWACPRTPCVCMCDVLLLYRRLSYLALAFVSLDWACLCVLCVSMCDVLRGRVHVLRVSACVMCCYIEGFGLSIFEWLQHTFFGDSWVISISTVVYIASGNHAKFVSAMASWLLLLCCRCKIQFPLSTWAFLFFSYSFMVSYKQGM